MLYLYHIIVYMVKNVIKNEDTKFAFALKTIVISILSIISTCCIGGYAVGYYKSSIDHDLEKLRLQQNHQEEISLMKEEQIKLRMEIASLKNNSVENLSSIIKLIKNNEKNN